MSHADESYYVWQEQDANGWGVIVALSPLISFTAIPLMHRDLDIVKKFESVALEHGRQAGTQVRLARYVFSGTVDV